jgi:hypothetical protein
MSLTLLDKANTTARGLDVLVRQLELGGVASLGHAWQTWFESAASQLESDDSIDARLTDELAESLAEAEEAIMTGYNCAPALRRLVSLYYRNQQSKPLETLWREKAANLGLVQLETRTWDDLHKALDAAAQGRSALVARWIDKVEETFLAVWESYQQSDILEEEVTAESVLGHRLLREGVEGWLEALSQFRDTLTAVDRAAVLAQAEVGQRLLMVVQVVEQEAQDSVGRFMAAWAN